MNWVQDKDINNCMKCGAQFTALRRKHHCRSCGNIYCDNCMKKGDFRGKGQEKICLSCIDKIDREKRERKAWNLITNKGFCTPCGRHVEYPSFSCKKTPEGLWTCTDHSYMIVDLTKNQWVVKDQMAYLEYLKSKEVFENDKKEQEVVPDPLLVNESSTETIEKDIPLVNNKNIVNEPTGLNNDNNKPKDIQTVSEIMNTSESQQTIKETENSLIEDISKDNKLDDQQSMSSVTFLSDNENTHVSETINIHDNQTSEICESTISESSDNTIQDSTVNNENVISHEEETSSNQTKPELTSNSSAIIQSAVVLESTSISNSDDSLVSIVAPNVVPVVAPIVAPIATPVLTTTSTSAPVLATSSTLTSTPISTSASISTSTPALTTSTPLPNLSTTSKDKSNFTIKSFFQNDKKEILPEKIEKDNKTMGTKDDYPKENPVYPVVLEQVYKDQLNLETLEQQEEPKKEESIVKESLPYEPKIPQQLLSLPDIRSLYKSSENTLLNINYMDTLFDMNTLSLNDSIQNVETDLHESSKDVSSTSSSTVSIPVSVNTIIETLNEIKNLHVETPNVDESSITSVTLPEEQNLLESQEQLNHIIHKMEELPLTVDLSLSEAKPESIDKYTSLSVDFLANIIINSNVAIKNFTFKMNKYKNYCEDVHSQVTELKSLLENYKKSITDVNTVYSSCINQYQQEELELKAYIKELQEHIKDYEGEVAIQKNSIESSIDLLNDINKQYEAIDEEKSKYIQLYQEEIRENEHNKTLFVEHIQALKSTYREKRRDLISQISDIDDKLKSISTNNTEETNKLYQRIEELENELENEKCKYSTYKNEMEKECKYELISLESLPVSSHINEINSNTIIDSIKKCFSTYPDMYSEHQIEVIQNWFNTLLTKKNLSPLFKNTLELNLLPADLYKDVTGELLYFLVKNANNKDFYVEIRHRNQTDLKIHAYDKPRVKTEKKFASAIIE